MRTNPIVIAVALALFLTASAGAAPSRAKRGPATTSRRDSTTVILLGTGMPAPDPKAQGPATAITCGDRIFLFDAGAGVMRQLSAADLHARQHPLTAVFLTHLHSDHTLGLPDVMMTTWIMGRRTPLALTGPPGTRAMVRHLEQAWSEDTRIRTEGLEHEAPRGYVMDVRETSGGVVYDSAGVRITAFRVPHGTWKFAFGYRIDAPGKSIVISGDTAPSPELEKAAAGVDLLIHEVYPAVKLTPETRQGGQDWPAYMHSFHTSDRELGAIAARAKVKRLVLHHIVRMNGTDEELRAGIRAGGYRGPVSIGRDLERY